MLRWTCPPSRSDFSNGPRCLRFRFQARWAGSIWLYTSLIKCLKTNAFPPLPQPSHIWYTMPVSDDPFDAVLRPPPNESPEQCQLRLSRETEAKRVSMVIDANIKAERQARRKKRIVRLLLLGQSESGQYVPYSVSRIVRWTDGRSIGKSTTLRRKYGIFRVFRC